MGIFLENILPLLFLSFLFGAIFTTICTTQFKHFLDKIGMSKYYQKNKSLLLNIEHETDENKLYEKFTTKIMIFSTIFIFIILIIANLGKIIN